MLRQNDARWSNPKVLTIFALIFVCGLAFGVVGTNSFFHSKMHSAHLTQMSLDQLKVELQLSPEQEKIIAKELDDYAKYYQNIEEERADVANTGKEHILRVLSPRQRKRFLGMFDSPGIPHADPVR